MVRGKWRGRDSQRGLPSGNGDCGDDDDDDDDDNFLLLLKSL